ncbi:hypothetical protein BH10BAC3_BH10BAC3_04640 [soil metagenome]
MPVYKRNQWLLVVVFFLCSCWQAKPGRDGILSINAMKLVMWDMVQVDEFASVYVKKDTIRNLQKETNILYQKVFALHKIDSATFFKSFYYYKKYPDNYKILLDSLNAFASRERENRFYLNKITPTVKPQ